MKLLHTSDWHLGHQLCGRSRVEAHAGFLDWLLQTLRDEAVDVLLVAGDVFDTGTPGVRAQQQYYRFLCAVAATGCRHVVVIGGNHDSPGFLDAPRELLDALSVKVVGGAAAQPEDEALLLRDASGRPELLVCAVPYLRERELRQAEAGEAAEDKQHKLVAGLNAHYRIVAEHAHALARTHGEGRPLPVVAMGHLFAAGASTLDGDGVRELYIGALAQIGGGDLAALGADYVALGHLHRAQTVGGLDHIRYSGAPLAMGFAEAGLPREVLRVDLRPDIDERYTVQVTPISVPCFQPLARIQGRRDEILAALDALVAGHTSVWVEVVHRDDVLVGGLSAEVAARVENSPVSVLQVRDERRLALAMRAAADAPSSLASLTPEAVFQCCLDANQIAGEQQAELRASFDELLVWMSLREQEANEEGNACAS